MKIKILFLSLFVLAIGAKAQDATALQYGKLVSAEDLKEYLSILASDALEGRETGTRGQKMAAAFIAAHFQELGLTGPVNGSYYQAVDLYSSAATGAYLKIGKNTFENFAGILYFGSGDTGGELSLPVVFAGNGAEADLAQVDVKDKAVIIFSKDVMRLSRSKVFSTIQE